MTLSDPRPGHRQLRRWRRNPHLLRVSPDYPNHPSGVPCPITPADRDRCSCRLLPCPTRPSPFLSRVGIRDFTFEACSGFTRVTARQIAQPPKAAFVARLQPGRLPRQAACQLPDQTDTNLGGTLLHRSSGRTEKSGLGLVYTGVTPLWLAGQEESDKPDASLMCGNFL